MSALVALSLVLAAADGGVPAAVGCPVADAGVVSLTWSELPDAKLVLARVLWAAYPGDPPAPWPEATCVEGGVRLSGPQWLPFTLAFEEKGEALRVDLAPARAVLDDAFARPPGTSLTDAPGLSRRAQHTAYALRHLAPEAGRALQADANDLELRERAWASPAELANALARLSKTARGRELAARVEERLVLVAPFVMRDLHLVDSREGAAPPIVFWRGEDPCLAQTGAPRCTDPLTGATSATRGLERGDSLHQRSTLVHTPPRTLEGAHDEATAVMQDGERQWTPQQLVVSARAGRFSSAPADVVFSPSRAAGVVLVPSYGGAKCKPKRAAEALTRRFSCEATWRVEFWEAWAFSTR